MRYYKENGVNWCEPDCTEEWLDLIWQTGFDYDGYHTSKDLKELIDELVQMAKSALKCLHEGKIFIGDVNEKEVEYKN